MNSVSSYQVAGPYGKTEQCAQLTIDTPSMPFRLSNVMTIGDEFTFSCWIKSDTPAKVSVIDKNIETGSEWIRHEMTFVSESEHLTLMFDTSTTYYIYNPKLEVGNVVTDWSPAPEDQANQKDVNDIKTKAESVENEVNDTKVKLQMLEDSIKSLVRGADGASLVEQNEDGLYFLFDISSLEDGLSDATNAINDIDGLVRDEQGRIDVLNSDVDALKQVTEYIKSGVIDDKPFIELGDESAFKMVITNTDIQFKDGSTIPARISNKKLNIETAQVRGEFQVGDDDDERQTGIFVWKVRANGNMGLTWRPKEVLADDEEGSNG